MQDAWLLQSPRLETGRRSERATTPWQGSSSGLFSGRLARAPALGNAPRLQVCSWVHALPRFSQPPKLPLCIRNLFFPSLSISILRSAPGSNKTLKLTLRHQMTCPPSHVRHARAGVIPFPACWSRPQPSQQSQQVAGPETTLDAQNTRKTHRPSGRASLRQDPPAPAHANARGTFSIQGKEWHSMFQMTRLLNWD